MKKRLRRKKHIGEFAEFGRQLIIKRNQKQGLDQFLDDFIEEAIEANGCFCGGGSDDKLGVVIELGRRSQNPEEKLEKIIKWVQSRSDVETYQVGPEFDLWHGEFQDIDQE